MRISDWSSDVCSSDLMQRWLIGSETGRSSRARGLKRRIEDLLADEPAALELLDMVNRAARALPAEGWAMRVADRAPAGPVETFLVLVRSQVPARSPGKEIGRA